MSEIVEALSQFKVSSIPDEAKFLSDRVRSAGKIAKLLTAIEHLSGERCIELGKDYYGKNPKQYPHQLNSILKKRGVNFRVGSIFRSGVLSVWKRSL